MKAPQQLAAQVGSETRRNRHLPLLALRFALLFSIVLLLLVGSIPMVAQATSPYVVISQVYGGGGTAGAAYKNSFIELFNRNTTTSVGLSGWSVQYAAPTSTSWSVTPLPDVTLAPGQYFLVQEGSSNGCNNNTAPCGLDLPTPDAIGTINLDVKGKVAVMSNLTALSTACTTGAVDLLGYYGTLSPYCYEGSIGAAALNNTAASWRDANGCVDTDVNGVDFAAGAPSPRNSKGSPIYLCSSPRPVQPAIHDIQGAGHISPYNTQPAFHVSGVITARRANGFYMESKSPDTYDGTSEGIFVNTVSAPATNLNPGYSVNVNGQVMEFRDGTGDLTLTEIALPTIKLGTSTTLPAAVVIGSGGRIPPSTVIEDDANGNVEAGNTFDPAQDGLDFYESLEGMLVQVNNAVVVGPTNSSGEVPVVGDDGANASVRTARGGLVIQSNDYNPERIILDNEVLAAKNLAVPSANVGDHLGNVVGIMDYSLGNFKLELTAAPTVVPGGLSQEAATSPGSGQLAVVTFDLQNLAPNDSRLSTFAGQIVNNLRAPDLIAIEDVEDNDGTTDAGVVDATTTFGNLISAIQTAGGPAYQFRQINPVNDSDGGPTGANVRQGFLFRTDRGLSFVDRPGSTSTAATTVIGSGSSTQLSYSPGRIGPTNTAFNSSRKPLAGEFMYNGHHLFVIANEFISKSGDQPLFGQYQPPALSSETQRVAQAQAVHDFVNAIVTADPNADVIVLGDLNDFQFSNPLATLKGSPSILNNLMDTLPLGEQYTYVYDGNSEALDHTLLSNHLSKFPVTHDVVHTNSEFVSRPSDHDPQVTVISINSAPPTVDAGGPYTVNEGGSVMVSATGTDPAGGSLNYAWDLDNNGTFETAGQSVPFSAAALDGPSSQVIQVQVTNSTGSTAVAQATVNVLNVAPTATLSQPTLSATTPVYEGGQVTLSLTNPYDPSAADVAHGFTYLFDCADGKGYVTDTNTHACTMADNGTFTLKAKIQDKDGGFTEYTTVVTVLNVAPIATFANISGTINEGDKATLNFSNAQDSTADMQAGFWFSYDCTNDGTFEATDVFGGSSYQCLYVDNGVFTAKGRIKDKDGGYTDYTTQITVNNVAPTATFALSSSTINEGGAVTASFSGASDPGTVDMQSLKYSFDCTNDGTFEATDVPGVSYQCSAYPDNGVFTVKGRIKDKDGGYTDYTAQLTVNNVPPTVGAIVPSATSIPLGANVTVSASFTDPGVRDTHTAVWDWGDGTTSPVAVSEPNGTTAGSVSGSHTYAAVGTYTIKLTVTDKDGGSGQATYSSVQVYDTVSFATGGGWFDSAVSGASGRANIRFNARYQSGGVPTGSADFTVANLDFHSTSYDSLVLTCCKAIVRGSGTVNGAGDYAFQITGNLGTPQTGDFVRIVIWDKTTKAVLYDNQPGDPMDADATQRIRGGNLTIHK